MSKFNQTILISILSLLIFSFVVVISCEKKGTDSNVVFEPKTYLGTYSINKIVDMNAVTISDTMSFRFSTGNAVYIKLAIDDYPGQDRNFCDVTGIYTVSGNKLEIIIDTSPDGGGYIYPDGCNPAEIPEDEYIFYGRPGEIVFNGQDDEIDRQIILWLDEE